MTQHNLKSKKVMKVVLSKSTGNATMYDSSGANMGGVTVLGIHGDRCIVALAYKRGNDKAFKAMMDFKSYHKFVFNWKVVIITDKAYKASVLKTQKELGTTDETDINYSTILVKHLCNTVRGHVLYTGNRLVPKSYIKAHKAWLENSEALEYAI